MPVQSKKQFRYIQYLRSKYGDKSKAPEKYKWAFSKDWNTSDYKSLPETDKSDEQSLSEFYTNSDIRDFDKFYELVSSSIPQSNRPEKVKKVVKIGSIAKDSTCAKNAQDDTDLDEDFLKSILDKETILDMDILNVPENQMRMIEK